MAPIVGTCSGYASRVPRRGNLPSWGLCLIVVALTAGCANNVEASSSRSPLPSVRVVSPNRRYEPSRIAKCFGRLKIVTERFGVNEFASWARPLMPKGVTGELNVIGVGSLGGQSLGSPGPSSLFGPPIDDVVLYFFRSPEAARRGYKKIASFEIYGTGVPAEHRAQWILHPPPKSTRDANALQEVAGNIVIVWQFPRHRVPLSDRVLAKCLKAGRAE